MEGRLRWIFYTASLLKLAKGPIEMTLRMPSLKALKGRVSVKPQV